MAVRNVRLVPIERWEGYDAFVDPQETTPAQWIDSLNCVVQANGNATALRSPANFNTALAIGNKILSGVEYDRTAGTTIFFDINASSGTNVTTYSTTGGANTSRRTGQADAPWQSLNVNDRLFRVNGVEFIQYVTSFAAYAVGITKPAAAPVAVLAAGGAGALTTGVYLSYAYYNVSTTHIGEVSAASGISGATSAGSNTVSLAVVASAQTGVSNIVVFISEDGGTVRYLLVDSAGDLRLFSNATGSITASVATIYRNYNVEETVLNAPPPAGITFISRWKNRIIAAFGRFFQYSGFDQISAGVPQEAWPPLNIIAIPSKSEVAKGGIETPIGWLALSDRDAYLLSGEPTDKVDSGENTLQITEQFDQLGWNLGTRSPLSLQNTPYGTVWLDQNKHLQLWEWQGKPKPICLGVWPDLATIQDTDAALGMAQGQWFGAGGASGGFYVLTASTSSSTNNRCWFVTLIETKDGLQIVPAPSSIAAQCVFTARISGKLRCFIGVTDRLREILDFDLAGAGWASTDTLYFSSVIGNQLTNFNGLHSLRLDGTNPQDAIVRVSNLDGSLSQTLRMTPEMGDYFGLVDRYLTRHKVTVAWPNDDAAKRDIKNMRFAAKAARRVI